MAVVVETTLGDFTIDLCTDERPRSCLNFLKLCKLKYYNFNVLYSIERNFVAQTGDPTGTGRGGDSIFKTMYGDQARLFEGEKLPILKHTDLGTVSMVAYGKNMYGSQFFITLGDQLDSLDGEHLVIGHVSEGLDVIAKLNEVLTDEKNRPYQDICISHTVILDDPFPDPDKLVFSDESPRPTPEVLASDCIGVDENVEEMAEKDMKEIQEEIAAKEAEARATILEMVGDLPFADMAPPENVLFVCKLNPVTTSEDLEIIFSRFGKIMCAEVIKDRITGNSLQYAFIEFDNKKSCEDAFFKMDNVLIDDRRIHVDFSQSVSKIKWRGRGRGVDLYDDKGKKVEKKEPLQAARHQRQSNENNEHKSIFIDTEAYGKRFKERQEYFNDHHKYQRVSGSSRNNSWQPREKGDKWQPREKGEYRDDRERLREKDKHRDDRGRQREKDEHRDERGQPREKGEHREDRRRLREKDEHRDDRGRQREKDEHRDERGQPREKDEHRDDRGRQREKDRHNSTHKNVYDRYSGNSSVSHSSHRNDCDALQSGNNTKSREDRHYETNEERKNRYCSEKKRNQKRGKSSDMEGSPGRFMHACNSHGDEYSLKVKEQSEICKRQKWLDCLRYDLKNGGSSRNSELSDSYSSDNSVEIKKKAKKSKKKKTKNKKYESDSDDSESEKDDRKKRKNINNLECEKEISKYKPNKPRRTSDLDYAVKKKKRRH